MRESDRTETRCAHCGELFGADPDAHVLIKIVTGGPQFCRQKGIGHGNAIERCRRLEGHVGRHIFKGEGDALPPDPHYHEACWRQAFPRQEITA